jgi:hypothetical protein
MSPGSKIGNLEGESCSMRAWGRLEFEGNMICEEWLERPSIKQEEAV